MSTETHGADGAAPDGYTTGTAAGEADTEPGHGATGAEPEADQEDVLVREGSAGSSPSVHDLIVAYQSHDRAPYQALRSRFVEEYGKIQDEYIAVNSRSGVYLLDITRWPFKWRHSYRIKAHYAKALDPEVDDAIRKTRFEESRWRPILSGRSEEIVLTQLFSLIVSLMRVQDLKPNKPQSDEQTAMITKTAADVKGYVPVIQRFASGLARRATLQAYFSGMPFGVIVASLVIFGLTVARRFSLGATPLSLIGTCAAAGGVGAVISVMVRITNNDNLNIDYERGWGIAFIVGSFRPIIGAVFGGMLLIFLKSGLIAITIAPASGQDVTLFPVALGFLAGFSERWAQDTIVNSAPTFVPAKSKKDSSEFESREAEVTTPPSPPR